MQQVFPVNDFESLPGRMGRVMTHPITCVDSGSTTGGIPRRRSITTFPEPDTEIVVRAFYGIPRRFSEKTCRLAGPKYLPSATDVVETGAEAVVILNQLHPASHVTID